MIPVHRYPQSAFRLTPARLLIFSLSRDQTEIPKLGATADQVLQRLGPLVPDQRPPTPTGRHGGLYWSPPERTHNQRATLGRAVTRAHPEAQSDPDLPAYSEDPTASQLVILGIEPPPEAHIHDGEVRSTHRDSVYSIPSQPRLTSSASSLASSSLHTPASSTDAVPSYSVEPPEPPVPPAAAKVSPLSRLFRPSRGLSPYLSPV